MKEIECQEERCAFESIENIDEKSIEMREGVYLNFKRQKNHEH